MDKKNFNFFVVFSVLIVILLGVFVLAALAPIDLVFEQNVTSVYDEGDFTVNWTAVSTKDFNYTIYIYADDILYTEVKNDSTTGYSFSNTTDANYTFTIEAENSTGKANSTNLSMIVDNTAPIITISLPSAGWKIGNISIHTNSTDATANVTSSTMYFWFGNSTGNFSTTLFTSCPYVSSATGFNCSATFNTSDLADGNYTLWINASDTSISNVKNQSKTLIGIDNTAPTVTLSSSSSSKDSLTISISASDSTSGITGTCTSNRSGAIVTGSTSFAESGLSCGISHAYLITCTDVAGNAGSVSTSFSTNGCGGGSSSSSSTTTTIKKAHTFTKITPGVVSIMKNFDEEIGVKEIRIEVNNEAQNVKITISKFDGKPAAVYVEKTGKVYQYLQIDATNLGNNLEKAVVIIKVKKSWISENALDKAKIALFKFDENLKKWNELSTVYDSSDDTYDYFDVELTSFSYFVISEKTVVGEEAEEGETVAPTNGETPTTGGTEKERNLKWLWIVIIVLVVLVAVAMNREKINFLKK